MQLSNSELTLRADSAPPSGAIAEIDLYSDLCDFLELSPEERRGRRHQPDSQQPRDQSAPVKEESDQPPTQNSDFELEPKTDHAFKVVDISANEQPSAPEATADQLTGFYLDGMSPLEILETVDFQDQSACLAASVETSRALSQGFCLGCGAESKADDLFCITCGDFLDEVASTASSSKCADCGQDNIDDEIFCPWCGSSLPA